MTHGTRLNPDGTYSTNWEAALESINMSLGNWSIPTNLMVAPNSQESPPIAASSSIAEVSSLAPVWPVFATSVIAAMASVKTFIATAWVPVLAAGSAIVAVIAIVAIVDQVQKYLVEAEQIRAIVYQRVNDKTVKENELSNYSVYVIHKLSTNQIHYIGMTMNYPSRKNSHLGGSYPRFNPPSEYEMVPVYTNMTREEARSMEQSLIMAFTLDALIQMVGGNKINSIAPSKMINFEKQLERVDDILSKSIPE